MATAIDVLMQAASASQERRKSIDDNSMTAMDRMTQAMQKNRQLGIMQQSANTDQSLLDIKTQELEIEKIKAQRMNDILGQVLAGNSPGSNSGSGMQMKGFSYGGLNFEDPNFEAQKKTATKGAADEAQINNFTGGMANLVKSIENASPGDTDPTSARFRGIGAKMGAAIGTADPKVTAELDTLKIKARSTIKDFESGKLTDKDIDDAVSGISGINRNTTERLAKAVSLSRQIASDRGVEPAVVDEKIAASLGITVEQMNDIVNGKIKPKEASKLIRGEKKEFKVGDTKKVGDLTYVRGEDGKWRPKS